MTGCSPKRFLSALAVCLGLMFAATAGPALVALAQPASSLGRQAAVSQAKSAPALSPAAPLETRVMGHGQPLVLLTGYAMTKEMWDADFLKALARHNRLLLMDYRGMGETPLGQDVAVSLRAMAEDVAKTLASLHIQRAHVLGWSMGGMVAQELALDRPDKVCSLVLLNTAGDFASVRPAVDKLGAMPAREILERMFPAAWVREHPEAPGRVQPRPRPVDKATLGKYYEAMLGWEGLSGRVGRFARPVLLLAGSEDWVCPAARSQELFDLLARTSNETVALTLLAHGSHWMMHQYPEALAQAIQGFLSLHPCPRPPGS